MGYITLFGITFWVPDFNDLWNYVVTPLRDAIVSAQGNIISGLVSYFVGLASQVVNALRPILDPIWNFLQGLAAKIYELLKPLIDPIWQFLKGVANQIWQFVKPAIDALWNMIKPTIDNLWNFMKGILQQIVATIKPWIDALGAAIHGDLAPLWSLVKPAIDNILQSLNRAIPQLSLGILGLQVGLDALSAKVSGQPVEFDKILAAKLNETLNPLAGIDKSLWEGFNDVIVKPLSDLFTSAWAGFLATVQGYGAWVMDTIHGIAQGGPEAAVTNLAALAFTLGPMMTGINIAAQAIELIHPIKHMGIVQTVTSLLDSLGVRQFAFGAYALLVAGALEKPVRQGLALRYRPEIPDRRVADTMYFQQQITIDAWRRIYALSGWAETYITAWYHSMWTEPSDRMIVAMIEGGEIELEWLQEKLLRRRYRPEDAARIMRYGTRKALSDEIKAIISEVGSDLSLGIVDIEEAEAELGDIGVRGKELEFRMRALKRRMARADIKEKIAILTSQVQAYELTVELYRNELIALGLRTPRVSALVEKEELRRKPKVKAPAETRRQMAITFYVRLYIEGTISDELLRRYLSDLKPALKPADLELIITDARIRRAKAVAAA